MTFDTQSEWGRWKAQGLARICLSMIDRLPVNGLTRRLAFPLRKPVKTGTQACYDREIWGLKLRLMSKGNLTEQRWLSMPNFHDRPEREALAKQLIPGSVFLDVGANAGFYTFWALSRNHEDLRVLAIEPSPGMVERLQFNLAGNHLEKQVTLFSCAVTEEPGDVFLEENAGNMGQSGLSTSGHGLNVEGNPLLDLLEQAGVNRVDAIKIDIEGHEVAVLETFFANATESLWPKLIIAEIVGDNRAPLIELLHTKGYRLEQKTKMNGIFIHNQP